MNLLSSTSLHLEGLVGTHDGLQYLSDSNCILRAENNPSDGRVKLISGGGSGHEPAHAGYVGRGMLSGAVCGNIFSSPSVSAIVSCLQTVARKDGAGVIMIVKNYTGDRLNFGIALERAKSALGPEKVRMLLVGDDCSIDVGNVRKSVGKRGLAGVVLVHKILGAMAETEHSIDDIYDFGRGLIEPCNLATIGFTFKQNGNVLEQIEIGKGIHGEPGVYKMQSCADFNAIIEFSFGKLISSVAQGSEIVLLVNNLGGTSEFLMGVFMKQLMDKIGTVYSVKRTYCGTFLSSFDQAGISITVLNVAYSEKLFYYLDAPVNVPSSVFGKTWEMQLPKSFITTSSNARDLSEVDCGNKFKLNDSLGVTLASTIIVFVCEALISCTDMLNLIDKEAGDGDTGTTVGMGAKAVLDQLNASKLDLANPALLLEQISILLQEGMGGSSGALYSLFFQGASNAIRTSPNSIDIKLWNEALSKGITTIIKYALTEKGDRTMLDPLIEGQQRLEQAVADENRPVLVCLEAFTKGCEEAARDTQHMVPKSGRAAYAASTGGESSIVYQHPDPGAHAVSIWARAMFEAAKQVIIE